jgi:cellobiose PTS system EIIB component
MSDVYSRALLIYFTYSYSGADFLSPRKKRCWPPDGSHDHDGDDPPDHRSRSISRTASPKGKRSMKIVVVCGAGASSTFVAVKLRSAAAARGLRLEVAAGSASQLDSLSGIDVVLVGAHLEAVVPELRARADATGTAIAVLPPVSPAALDGAGALELALSAKAGAR